MSIKTTRALVRTLSAVGVASALSAGMATAYAADTVKVGIMMGFTGPIESLTPPMAAGAEAAFAEANESGNLLDGTQIESVRADSTCVDAGAATAAAERLVTSDNIVAMVGADCSGVTIATVNNVAVANGLAMVLTPTMTTVKVLLMHLKALMLHRVAKSKLLQHMRMGKRITPLK